MNVFTTSAPAKFILTGEHSVLRGGQAVAFPLPELKLSFKFTPRPPKNIIYHHKFVDGDRVDDFPFPDVAKDDLQDCRVFNEVLKKALSVVGLGDECLEGRFQVDNQIPIGCGLGASAACSLVVARWIEDLFFVDEVTSDLVARSTAVHSKTARGVSSKKHADSKDATSQSTASKVATSSKAATSKSAAPKAAAPRRKTPLMPKTREAVVFAVAREIENYFHNQSSGLDIAAVMHDQPIVFCQGRVQPIKSTWQPRFRLTYSGTPSRTSKIVKRMKKWCREQPHEARQIDLQMDEASQLAQQALQNSNTAQAFQQLVQSVNAASGCFNQWGLITPEMQNCMKKLKAQGAAAVKPTGSGGGGYILSLWPSK